ncbi:MAG TPA: GNAT family protein [Ktedonobacteraceae bacterium]|jgi:ribosomal-protein-alanine N-acetyltransferase|nr:GNAT family protein [Ktedonobacteraceae bacterium]
MRQLEDLFSVFPLIETERLILRQLTLEDAEDFFVCHSDPEAFRYSRHSEETSLQSATHTLNRLLKWYQDRFMLCWAIVLKENQRFIGRIQMQEWSDIHHSAEVGYRLGTQYWGKGYATEALGAVIAYLFEQTTINRIYASTWAENIASARVLEKAGMRFEGLSRQKRFVKGAFRDTKNYAILREDFFTERGSL